MTAREQHIVFVCSRLDQPGGIERAIVNTANLLVNDNYRITLLVLDHTAEVFYPLQKAVSVRQLPLAFGIGSQGNFLSRKMELLSSIRSLRKELLAISPTIVIGTEYPFSIGLAWSGINTKAKIYAWEHHHYFAVHRNAFWNLLFRFFYPKLHGIICLNDAERKHFLRLNSQVVVIPNFVHQDKFRCLNAVPSSNRILTIGRLSKVKGIDLLLTVAQKVLQQNPEWEWMLIGDGELEKAVKTFVDTNSLHGQFLLRAASSPFMEHEYREASLYVMTSRNECLPMTLLEALQQGLPCISFDCETGPRFIIQHRKNGMLVEKDNVSAMVAAIQQLIDDEGLRQRQAAYAPASLEVFSEAAALTNWRLLINP